MFAFNEKGGMGPWGLIVAPPPQNAVPQVIASVSYCKDANLAVDVEIPPENSAGDRMLLVIGTDGFVSNGYTLPAGWVKFTTLNHPSFGNGCSLILAWKNSDGTEVDFSFNISERQRICGSTTVVRGFLDTQDPEEGVGVCQSGTTQFPDPPSITPTWGTDNNLYFAVGGYDSGSIAQNSPPTNYSLVIQETGGGLFGCGHSVNSRAIFGSTTEDPDTINLNFATETCVNTIAMRGKSGASINSTHLVPEGSVTSPRVEDPMITEQGDFLFTE